MKKNKISERLRTILKEQSFFETADYYCNRFKKQGLTDEEIAESFVLPTKYTPAQREKDNKFFKERIHNMTEEEKEKRHKALQDFLKRKTINTLKKKKNTSESWEKNFAKKI